MPDEISVNGAVAAPFSIDPAALTTSYAPVTVAAGSGSDAASYAGVSVYALISAAKFLYPTAGVKNGFLRDYVAVTASGGEQVVLSEGEVDPGFGGAGSTDIIATSRNGTAIAPTLVVPGDASGARDIGGVTSLAVGVAAVPPALPGTPAAPGLTLGGLLPDAGTTETAATLEGLPSSAQTDTFLAGTSSTTSTFTGPGLYAVLGSAGLNASGLPDEYAVATGSDGYGVVYSGGEANPNLRGSGAALPLVAYSDGASTPPSAGGVAGALRTTAPSDSKGGRYVSMLANLSVSGPDGDAVQRLYQAALGRLPDAGGSSFWSGLLAGGTTLSQVAAGILQSTEFGTDSGAGLSDGDFVNRLYEGVLGRAADAGGSAYWTGLLAGGAARADVLAGIAGTPEAILHGASAAGLAA